MSRNGERAATDTGGSTPPREAGVARTGLRPVGLPRRLAAAAYDTLPLFALLFVATALLLPFTGGEAVAPGNPVHLLYLLVVAYLYFGWFWTHGGQTLGMRAWHIRVRAISGGAVTWKGAALRFLAALLSWAACGAGFLRAAFDAERRTWHDLLSRTVLETTRD